MCSDFEKTSEKTEKKKRKPKTLAMSQKNEKFYIVLERPVNFPLFLKTLINGMLTLLSCILLREQQYTRRVKQNTVILLL